MHKPCPHCRGMIPEEAAYCLHCNRIVQNYRFCTECREPISLEAVRCPYCTQKVPTDLDIRVKNIQMTIIADRVGAFLLGRLDITALFHPPRLEIESGRIRMTRWGLLGLRTYQQEIRIDRVASVKYTEGIIWGGIMIETFGGATEDISQNGFEQDEAKEVADKLKEIISN